MRESEREGERREGGREICRRSEKEGRGKKEKDGAVGRGREMSWA